MSLVPRDRVSEAADRQRMAIGNPAPGPCLVVQAAEEQQMRPADQLELMHEDGQGTRVEPAELDVGILVEARQRGRIVAGEPEGTDAEDPFAVDQVADDLLDAPGVGARAASRPPTR